jgi:hypothetical protein
MNRVMQNEIQENTKSMYISLYLGCRGLLFWLGS